MVKTRVDDTGAGRQDPDPIEAYIAQFPSDVQEKLRMLRKIIRQEAPGAEEKISYRMPTFVLHGDLVYFAGFKRHIGLYPLPSGVEAFAPELAGYRTGKASIQFPIDKPLPAELIARIVRFRVAENTRAAGERRKDKAAKG